MLPLFHMIFSQHICVKIPKNWSSISASDAHHKKARRLRCILYSGSKALHLKAGDYSTREILFQSQFRARWPLRPLFHEHNFHLPRKIHLPGVLDVE
jgi:hypothetical protein